ncbi:TIGR02270 family protein [Archangium violaceum]|uniref:TIGR02270 family protein n=1 Tax=Archangium violaceum TaxID=83451 RepID=UPI00193C4536|nr:TIGR02270 family protein [Archangium violaceum]QRK06478.1 TIGR02270 family protein [Archangium violaceum]
MALREDLLPRWDIFEEHLDEASFLWSRRERCLVSPLFDLDETGREEQRLLAHLEALAEGGRLITERLVEPALESDEPERIAAAAWVLLAERGDAAYEGLLMALEEGEEGRRRAIQRALELWEGPERAERLKPLLTSPIAALRVLALQVSAFHAEAPDARTLAPLLAHEDSRVRSAALRCARFLPEASRAGLIPAALAAPAPAVRRAGIELGLLSGSRAAWVACRELAQVPSAERAWAWGVLAFGGGDRELELVLRGLGEENARASALWALGFSGRLAAADACLEAMREAPVAALAAESFSAITGLRIEGRYAGAPPESDEALPPLEEDLETDLVPKPEEDLPVPAVDAIARWWQQARGQFDPRMRYLFGQPFSGDTLLLALERAAMRRRHVLALELALRTAGAVRLQTHGLVARQRGQLEAASGSRILVNTFDKLMTAG